MPSHRSQEHIETAKPGSVVEKVANFTEVQEQREALLKRIESESLKLDMHEKYLIVSHMLGHSVKDGFEMAKRLGVGLEQPLASVDFNKQNTKFAIGFGRFMGNNDRYVGGPGSDGYRIIKQLTNTFDNPDQLAVNDAARPFTPHKDEIDAYYTNFIRNHRLESPKVPADPRTQVEITAEDHLLSAEAVLYESYYTGPIRKELGIETDEQLVAELKRAQESEPSVVRKYVYDDIVDNWRSNLITKHHLRGAVSALGKSIDSDGINDILKRSRYAPSRELFDQRKKESIRGLLFGRKNEGLSSGKPHITNSVGIKESLIKRGFREEDFEIIFNEEKSEWEIVDKHDAKENKVEYSIPRGSAAWVSL